MGTVFLCCAFAVVLQVTCGKVIETKTHTPALPFSSKCDIDELGGQGYTIYSCSGEDLDDPVYVKHGGACKVVDTEPDTIVEKHCVNGIWLNHGTSLDRPHIRKKRWGFVAAVVGAAVGGAAVGYLACKWWCKGGVQVITKTPPKFTANCPPGDLLSEYIALAGTESATVTWTVPTASDDDGTVQSVQQVFGGSNGGTFQGSPTGRQHAMGYEATDNDGLKATCYFTFNVKVATCSALLWPPNGYRDCPNDNILGGACNYGCNTGYQLTPNVNTVTCESITSSPEWTTIPTCEKVTCGNPPEVTDGTLACNDAQHTFSSYCTVACSNGFELSGQVFTKCEADGSWFWLAPSTCTDDEQPQLSCTTPQLFYADRGSLDTSVYWQEPTATDNLDPDPAILKTDGPDMGVTLAAETSAFVRYKARDATGNESPECHIELRVLEISCGHPLDTLEDNDLLFDCTMSTYTYGDSCTLACDLNLPLEGTDLITCEQNTTVPGEPKGYWDWGSGERPYCKDIACPDLGPPINGALVYDTINNRPVNTMLCNDQFDVPNQGTGFNGIFLCQDSGTWVPNLIKAPDCVEPFTSRGMQLPSEVWYYSGTCGVDDNILEQFEQIVDELNVVFPALCPTSVSCSVVNPQITCGEIQIRKKKSTDSTRASIGRHVEIENNFHSIDKRQAGDVIFASFDIQTDSDYSGMTRQEYFDHFDYLQLDILKPAVQNMIDDGRFNIPTLELRDDSFRTAEYGDFYCDAGATRSGNTNTCSPCSPGRYEHDGVCYLCPFGEYSDMSGSSTCTKCPDGYSTRHNASESADNCTEQCSPGSYSPDTFAPCAQCKIGFYQSQSGQKMCTACPTGKTTTKTGRTTVSDCQYFDIVLDNTHGEVQTAHIALLHNISITFWTKTVSGGSSNTLISIEGVVDFVIADTITVHVKSNNPVSYDLGPSSSDAWVFVAITWDTTNSILSGYYNGDMVVREHSVSSVSNPVVQGADLIFTANTAVMLSGFSLKDTVTNEAGVNEAAESCQATNNNDIVSMEHFKNINEQAITLLTPSVCDAIDGCANATCGSNRCTDEVEGFTCTCSNGWSGVTCNIPPDYCINNDCTNDAACVSGTTDYTCQCEPGYTGVFCETPPVNGDWSVWSSWSDCTQTCNSGTHQRTRACDSPVPDDYGQTCDGADVETQTCNTSPCPECLNLTRGFGNRLVCTTTTIGSQSCMVTCKDGHLLPNGLETDTRTCGVDTNYVWHPSNKVPDCTRAGAPDRYAIHASGSYLNQIVTSDVPGVQDGVIANTLGTDCYNALMCTTLVRIDHNKRRKRNTGSTITLSFTISLTDTSDLELEDFTANNTVSTALQEIIDAINNLQSTANAINSSASSIFDVTVNGGTYTIDPSTVTFDGTADCPSGQVVTEALCVECPYGTYKNDKFCSYCDKGTYQSQAGQSVCTSCPSGFSTVTIGSDSITDCTVPVTTTTSTFDIVTTTSPTTVESSTSASSNVVVKSTVSTSTSATSTPTTITVESSTYTGSSVAVTSTTSGNTSSTSTPTTVTVESSTYAGSSVAVTSSTSSYTSTTSTPTSKTTVAGATSTSATPHRESTSTETDPTVIYIGVTVTVVSLVILVLTIIVLKKHQSSRAKVSDSSPNLRGSSNGHIPPILTTAALQMPCKVHFQREHSNAISLQDLNIEEDKHMPPVCHGGHQYYSSLYDP